MLDPGLWVLSSFLQTGPETTKKDSGRFGFAAAWSVVIVTRWQHGIPGVPMWEITLYQVEH